MPEDRPVPQVPYPIDHSPPPGYGPLGATVQQAGWIGRQFATMTDGQMQKLFLGMMQFCSLFLIGWLIWSADRRQERSELKYEEMNNQLRRDIATNDEKHRQNSLATGTMLLKHCSDQDKIRRDEEGARHKDVIAVQSKLADAVNMLTRKVSGMKDADFRE